MDTKRTRSVAADTKVTRTRRPPIPPKTELVTFRFDIDAIRRIIIAGGATGVVINPPRPRPGPFQIELTIEQPIN